jgi:hypothetical protein
MPTAHIDCAFPVVGRAPRQDKQLADEARCRGWPVLADGA